jgi:multidrug efflux pump subunit AcrB
VAISLGTSYLVAMLLTPLMARFFIRQGLVNHEEEAGTERKLTPLDHMQRLYNIAITWAMANKRTVLAGSVLAFVAGIGILRLVPQLLFPLAERNQFVMDVWLPEGAKIEATDAAVRRIEAVLSREPMVKMYTSFLGESAPRFYYNVNPQAPAGNYAQILVNTSSVKGTPKLVARLRQTLPEAAPEARVFVKELQQGQVMEAPVEVRISGDDIATLETLGNQVEDIFRHTPGATYIHTDWHEDAWQVGMNVREEVANRMGLTNGAIAQQLAAGFEGAPVTTFWEGDRAVDVAELSERGGHVCDVSGDRRQGSAGRGGVADAPVAAGPDCAQKRRADLDGARLPRRWPAGERDTGRCAQATGRPGFAAGLPHCIWRRIRKPAGNLWRNAERAADQPGADLSDSAVSVPHAG